MHGSGSRRWDAVCALQPRPLRFIDGLVVKTHRIIRAEPVSGDRDKGLPHRIELNLRDVNQLFNTMDPSPFHEKDLDHDAEEFIVGWALEFPVDDPVELVVHLSVLPAGEEAQDMLARAVHHYFAYRARLAWLDFRRLMRQGWQSLLIGVVFLATCLVASEALGGDRSGRVLGVVREGLIIAGWVAMWRPMEIYLYEWWPLRRRGKAFEKLSRMPVSVRFREADSGA